MKVFKEIWLHGQLVQVLIVPPYKVKQSIITKKYTRNKGQKGARFIANDK